MSAAQPRKPLWFHCTTCGKRFIFQFPSLACCTRGKVIATGSAQ